MKTKLRFIPLLLAVIILLSSCGAEKSKDDTSKIKKTSDSAMTEIAVMPADLDFKPENDKSLDYDFTSEHYSEKSDFLKWHKDKYGEQKQTEPEKTVTVDFNGKTYSANYKSTCRSFNYYGSAYSYKSHSNEGDIEITVDAETGKFIALFIFSKSNNKQFDQTVCDRCREEAQEIAKQYIDTEFFEFEEEHNDSAMRFTYYISFNGQKTPYNLTVSYNASGELYHFHVYVTDNYKNLKERENELTKNGELATDEELKSITIDRAKTLVTESEIIGTEVKDETLLVTPDNLVFKQISVIVKAQCYERPEGYPEELYPLPFVKKYYYTAVLPYA